MALRKLLGTLGAIVLAAGLAAGCGKADTAPKEAQSPTAEEESVDAGAEEAEAKGGDAAEEAEGSDAAADTEGSVAAAEAEGGGQESDAKEAETVAAKVEVFPETILMDQDGIKVTVKGFDLDEYGERNMTVTMTNDTPTEIEAYGIEMIADGRFVIGQGSIVVPAGATVSEKYTLSDSDLKKAGIISIHDLSMRLEIRGDGLSDSPLSTDTVSVVTDTENEVAERDMSLFQELYNKDGVVVWLESKAHHDEFGDTESLILVQNSTDNTLLIEPILSREDGRTTAGYNIVPPHVEYTISNYVNEGDTCYVRISLVRGKHDFDELYETDEIDIKMP